MNRLSLLFCLLVGSIYSHAGEVDPPNVLILFIDDMGYADPSCFGNPLIETPHIDDIAKKGMMLTNFYVNSPICSASRVALATGQYQHRWRIHSFLSTRGAQKRKRMANYLDPAALHTAQLFQDAGYATAHFGKWHMGGGRDIGEAPLPTEYGFDESYVSFEGLGDRVLFQNEKAAQASEALGRGEISHAPKHDLTRIYVDKAIHFLERNQGTPFYLEVFPNDIHDGFFPKEGRAEQFAHLTKDPDEQKFLAVLEDMDREIGRLMGYLETSGLSENTIVIFTSDNGPTDWPHYYERGVEPPGFTGPFFGRKWSLYEGGIRMPFIIRWPARIPGNSEDTESIVLAMDLQPTLASLAGIPLPSGKPYDGIDRTSVFLGHPTPRPDPVFWEYGTLGSIRPGKPAHISPALAMRNGAWKLLLNPDGSDKQLYNLIDDPGETRNLASRYASRTQAMETQVLAWWQDMLTYFPE